MTNSQQFGDFVSQVMEYNEKKLEVINITAKVQQQHDNLTQEQKAYQDSLENEERSLLEVEDKIKQKVSKRDQEVERRGRLEDRIRLVKIQFNKANNWDMLKGRILVILVCVLSQLNIRGTRKIEFSTKLSSIIK